MDEYYSNNWVNEESFIYYIDNNFKFNRNVLIVSLDNCLINYVPINISYKSNYDLELFSTHFIDELKSSNKSIIVISNQINSNKRNIDYIKKRTELFINKTQIPLFCIFLLKPNYLMKPHTGSWLLLKALYKVKGKTIINNAKIVSNDGGIAIRIKNNICYTNDTDRAFANNINIPYQTIDEYMRYEQKNEFRWSNDIIEPSVREICFDKITNYRKTEYNNVSIIKTIEQMPKKGFYVIFIMGSPCSGKTKLANKIVKDWEKSSLDESHAVRVLSNHGKKRHREFKKLVDDRISVIIDGNCHNNKLRSYYINYLKDTSIMLVIDILLGGMCIPKLFNHSKLENCNNISNTLYSNSVFDIYKSQRSVPKKIKFISYLPIIEKTKYITTYRY